MDSSEHRDPSPHHSPPPSASHQGPSLQVSPNPAPAGTEAEASGTVPEAAASDSPAAFTPDELETWSAVATLLEWLPAALEAQMQHDSQISHFEFGILFALSEADEQTLRMSELAKYANSTLSRLSRAVARLERKSWVTRQPDPNDGRTTIATLLAPGRSAVRAASPGHIALVRQLVFDPLTSAQARHLRDSSRRITSAIREDAGWRPTGVTRRDF